jgi:hypothetical protein
MSSNLGEVEELDRALKSCGDFDNCITGEMYDCGHIRPAIQALIAKERLRLIAEFEGLVGEDEREDNISPDYSMERQTAHILARNQFRATLRTALEKLRKDMK